jgi:hypothetical protein
MIHTFYIVLCIFFIPVINHFQGTSYSAPLYAVYIFYTVGQDMRMGKNYEHFDILNV